MPISYIGWACDTRDLEHEDEDDATRMQTQTAWLSHADEPSPRSATPNVQDVAGVDFPPTAKIIFESKIQQTLTQTLTVNEPHSSLAPVRDGGGRSGGGDGGGGGSTRVSAEVLALTQR